MSCRHFSISFLIGLVCTCGCGSGTGGGQSAPPPSPNVFNGQYAFILSGFDTTGSPMGIIGSLTADGFGHITSGSVEVNDSHTVSSNSAPVTGSYSLDSNVRGVITLANTIGSVTQPLAFALTLRADGTMGDLIGFDGNNFIIAGTIQQQDKTTFSLAALSGGSGGFAFEFDSDVPSRSRTVGRLTLNTSGVSTSGLSDVSFAGTGSSAIVSQLSFTFAAAGPDKNGQGTLSVSENGVTTNYTYYIINAAKFFVIQTDTNASNTLRTGVAEKQNLPFSLTTVNTAASVFALAGFDTTVANAVSTIGLLQVTGSNTAALSWDTDDGGTIFSQQTASGQAVTFDMNTGRGTITIGGGFGNGLFDQAAFYLTDSGKGFVLDTSSTTHNRALAGRMYVQTGKGSFGGSTLSGNSIVRWIGQANSGSTQEQSDDALVSKTVNNNTFAVQGFIDQRNQSGQSESNLAISGTESFAIDSNTGRGTLGGGGAPNINVFYIIGKLQYVLIDETSPPHNSIPILFYDPQ